MTDLEPDEAELFGRARRGLSPSAGDQERLRLALGPALSGVPASPSVGSKLLRWGRVGGGVAVLGLAVAAGYGWGYHVGSQARPAPTVVKRSSSRALVPSTPTALPAPSAAPAAAPAAVLVERVGGPNTASSVASAAPPKEAPTALGLDEEVRQLRRIERAIRDGNSRLALAIGDNLDRDIPDGQLLLERRAARLMASCQLDAATGAAPAARYLADNPQSAYAVRLRELCGLAHEPQRNGLPPGTNDAENGGTR